MCDGNVIDINLNGYTLRRIYSVNKLAIIKAKVSHGSFAVLLLCRPASIKDQMEKAHCARRRVCILHIMRNFVVNNGVLM